MQNWEDRAEVKKGNIGERLVCEHLVYRGYLLYRPDGGQRHPFDRLCVNNGEIFVVEVKTYPGRKSYPDTGLTARQYEEYQEVERKHNLRVYIFFVDEVRKLCYGNFLSEMSRHQLVKHNGKVLEYPLSQFGATGPRIYFPMQAMKTWFDLSDGISSEIMSNSMGNQSYSAGRVETQIGLL